MHMSQDSECVTYVQNLAVLPRVTYLYTTKRLQTGDTMFRFLKHCLAQCNRNLDNSTNGAIHPRNAMFRVHLQS